MHVARFLNAYGRHPAVRVINWHLIITTSEDVDEVAAYGLLCAATLRAGIRLAEKQGVAVPIPHGEN